MKIRELTAWHRFTYTMLYPAVLGSMLYDVLHLNEGWGPLQMVELSITVLFCVDFFYLQGDLGSDQLPKGNWRDTIIDGAIAIAFGIAYWMASDKKLWLCYTCLKVVAILIALYHFTPDRKKLLTILPHVVLAFLFGGLAWYASQMEGVTWGFAAAAWVPTAWYALYVFGLANRFLPSGNSA